MEHQLQNLNSTEGLKMTKQSLQELEKIERELRRRGYANGKEGCKTFIKDLCKIKIEGGGIDNFKLWDYQEEIIEEVFTYKKICYLKSRQMGFSWVMAAIALWCIIFNEFITVSLMSKGEDEAKKQLARTKFMYEQLPEWIKPDIAKGGDNAQTFKLTNGSIINSLTAGGDGGRGDTAFLTIWDETAFSPNDEHILKALEPAAEKGILVLQSTPNGMGNVFHQKYEDESYFSKKYEWWRRKDRDKAWAIDKGMGSEETKKRRNFDQEYGCDFIGSSLNVFNLDIVREYAKKCVKPLYELDGLRVWEKPVPGMTYGIGVDVANNVFDGDYCTFTVMRKDTDKIVATFRKRMLATKYAPRIIQASRLYNKALIGVEKNNHGIVVLSDLKKLHANLYYQKFYDNYADKWTKKVGWHTNGKSKPLMIDELEKKIREKSISIYDKNLTDELQVFVYVEERNNEKTGALPNKHDDLVISTAICIQVMKDVSTPRENRGIDMFDEYGNYTSKKKRKKKSRFLKTCY